MKETNYFPKNLKYLREKNGMKEEELELVLKKIKINKKYKYNVPSIRLVEEDKRDINLCYVFELADYFNVSCADLIGIDISQK